MIALVCPVCGVGYAKVKYEHDRNLKLGRVSVCGRSCHATFMNRSPAKQAQTKAMLAIRNANQWGENNPNWGGKRRKRSKPSSSSE
jgi:hypothetical protein